MATVTISSQIDNVPSGEYQAVVSLVDAGGTPVTTSQSTVSVQPSLPPISQPPPTVTVS